MNNRDSLPDHIPVLSAEVLEFLDLRTGEIVIDATLGLGGHSKLFLEKIGKEGKLIGVEADEANLEIAQDNLASYAEQILYINRNFENLAEELAKLSLQEVHAVFFDLGLSSPQVDEAERGFSFLREGPLDMRYDRTQGKTAADLVNRESVEELGRILREYGEERLAKKIAASIVSQRKLKPFQTTSELTQLIESVKRPERRGMHPATRAFQALRIAVNQELETLVAGLEQGFEALGPGGRMVVISYHSLEDRIVKNFFRDKKKECICPPEVLKCECHHQPELKILTKKPIQSGDEEIQNNLRSRSAKLRAIQKI